MSRLLKFDVSQFDAIYEYTDELGRHLFFVWRRRDKQFTQCRLSDPDDEESPLIGEVKGVRRVLFMLPLVIDALKRDSTIYIVEGEKDVHTVMRAGRTATCNPGGAGKWRPEYPEVFRGTRSPIAIVADNDEAGLRHASQVYHSLRDVEVRGKLEFFVAKTGNDITDHLEAGYGLRELVRRKPLPRKEVGLAPRTGDARATKEVDSELPAPLRRVLKRLNAQSTGSNQWIARCPAHDDANPSLSIGLGDTQPVLLHCFAGCAISEIADALKMSVRIFSVLEPGPAQLTATLLSGIASESVSWLWSGRIPYGKLTILEGDPGTLKSTITLDIAARLSTGRSLPDGGPLKPSNVLLVSAEDDAADTILPRLLAAGADISKVAVVRPKRDREGKVVPTSLPKDTLELRRLIEEQGAELVVIDPITAYIDEVINTHNDASVRRALAPLGQVAQETGAAILLVRHLNKASGQDAMYRGTGSVAFTATVRSVLVVARHPDQPKVQCLASVKSNLDATPRTITYGFDVDMARNVPVVRWGELIDLSADKLLRGKDARLDAPKSDAAAAFLAKVLANGPVRLVEITRRAEEKGHSRSTLKRAKKRLGVQSRQVRSDDGNRIREWVWYLPDPVDETEDP